MADYLTDPFRVPERPQPLGLAICDWLRGNGINPNDVPIAEIPTIQAGRIQIRAYVRDPDGGIQLDTSRRDPVSTVLDVPMLQAPPTRLRDWIAGRVHHGDIRWSDHG